MLANSFILCYTSFTNYTRAQYFPEYNRLRECWVGRIRLFTVTDTFVKDILDETEEDLSNFSQMLRDLEVEVKRPTYKNPDVTRKPQLLHARDHLQYLNANFMSVQGMKIILMIGWSCLIIELLLSLG